MTQICIKQSRIIKLQLPKEYDLKKIQIGIPVIDDEANKIGLINVGDLVLPSDKYGVNCTRNAYGYSYTDKSQPKKKRYISTNWVQPFGNDYASSIAVDIYKPCYPRIEVSPTEIELELFEDSRNKKYVIANLTTEIRENYLKETVNIFLEIYGLCYIFSDEIRINDNINRHRCNWEILPPGEKPSIHLTQMLKNQNQSADTFDVARLKFLDKYQAEQIIEGLYGFSGYYAYVFKNYCVLESAVYGNATYIIPKENWEVLSQKTKQELIDDNVVVQRINHTEKWKKTIRESFDRLKISI